MGKDPAFLFYPGDWLGGTMGMSYEQKGCYLDLLMMQFNNGKFTESQAKQVLSICFDSAWVMLKQKFETDGTYYWNRRLQEEIEKRRTYIESRRLSGLTPKKKKAYIKRTLKHIEDENENGDKDLNEEEESIKIDFGFIVSNYHTLCPKMNKVEVINEQRKGFINGRVGEFGLDKVIEVLRMAGESEFLNGSNEKAWKADFEWIMRPTNFIKIMEGKYSTKLQKQRVDGYY